MDSYKKLNEYLNQPYVKNKNNRPTEKRNTRIVRTSKHSIGIKFHKTIIIDYFDDGRIRLDTGGWKTCSTRERMSYWQNEFSVYSMNHIMYLEFRKNRYLFEDNMILFPSGRVELNGELVKPMTPADEKKKLKLKEKSDKYCNNFIELFFKHKIDKPSQADCFYCQGMVQSAKLVNGEIQTKGLCINGDHILKHIDEKYYVPSLLNNAIKHNEEIGVYGLAPIDKHNIAWGFKYEGWENNPPWALDITKKRLKMILKRYVNQYIGLGIT